MITTVTADSIFNKMLDAKVTFLEDRIFDAAQINITRRIFRKARGSHEKPRNDSIPTVPDDDVSGEDDRMDKIEELVIDYD